jgi:hypothetical protein
MNDKQKNKKSEILLKKGRFFFKLEILYHCHLRPKLDPKLPTNQPVLPFYFVVDYYPLVDYEELSRLRLG